MITSQNIKLAEDLCEQEEGCRLTVYLDDLDFPTIGWGRKLKPGESYPDGITQDQADAFLLADLEVAYGDAERLVPTLDTLDDVRAAVVIDMSYNLGFNHFSGFHKFFAALAAGDYENSACEMKSSEWYGQHPNRSEKLCTMMRTGVWPQ